MKKLLFSIFALFFAVAPNLRAQTTPVPTWAQSYGFGSYDANNQPFNDNTYGSGADLPAAIAPMPDGGVVVAGRLAPNELNPGAQAGATGLVRYDRAGAIVWQQLLRQDNDVPNGNNGIRAGQNHVSQMRTDAAGNVFVSGALERDDGNIVAPFVAKFSPTGALVWQNSLNQIIEEDTYQGAPVYPHYNVGEYVTMDLTSDGGVVVGTSAYSAGNGRTNPIIVKFNADGAVGFHRFFYTDKLQYSAVLSVCEKQGGNGFAVLLLGLSSSGTEVLVLTDGNGNPVLQRGFFGGNANFVTRSADGGYFLLGRSDSGYSGTEVRKLRADLTPIWQRNFTGYNPFHGQDFVGTLLATPDGGCILGGQLAEASYKAGGNGANSALLLTLSSSGALRSAHLLGGPLGESFSGALSVSGAPVSPCLTTDGAVAFTTSTFSYATGSYYKADWWVVKAGTDGKVAGFGGTMSDPPLSQFTQADSSETAGGLANDYGPGLPHEAGSTTTTEPRIIQEDLGNNVGINKPTVKTQTTTPIPPPVHGGLSGMTFTVNESTDSLPGLADTVLRFRAVQGGRTAGLNVSVQVSTDLNPVNAGAATWTNLADSTDGSMLYVPKQNAFVLNSTAPPSVANVYFRAFAKGSGYPSPASAPVGPFDLTSSKPHLPPLALLVTTNGTTADLAFTAGVTAPPSGVAVRVQSSSSPGDETSWTDLADGNSGQMTRSTNPKLPDLFLLLVDKLPGSSDPAHPAPVYFRAIARSSGNPVYLDSISNFTGGYVLTPDTPPKIVNFQPPAHLSGSGTQADPFIVAAGQIKFSADATPDPQRPPSKITSLKLEIDGHIITDNPGAPANVDYRYTLIGEHVLEAVATDDLGATSRAATGAVYIQVIPPTTSAKAEHSTGITNSATATTPGRVFTAVVNNGIWSDPATWIDRAGNHGVPGANDIAQIGSLTVGLQVGINNDAKEKVSVVVGSISIGPGGRFFGNTYATFTVKQMFTISGGDLNDLDFTMDPGSTLLFVNSGDVTFGYSRLTNNGTLAIHGAGSLRGFGELTNRATIAWQLPLSIATGAGSDPLAGVRVLDADFLNSGIIVGSNVNSLLSQDGAGIVSHDSGGVVSNDGGSLVASGGGNIVSHDSGGIISHDSGGIVSHDSGGLLSQDGGGIVSHDSGGLVATGGGNFIVTTGASSGANATSHAKASTAPSGFTQTGGNTNLSAVTIVGSVTLNGGVLSGSGIIQGDLTNNGGYIMPGLIAVNGNLAQGADGTLVLENSGRLPSEFSQLSIGDAANLGGKLVVNTINGYKPDPADTFNPIGYSSVSGSFASVSGNTQLTINADGAIATVNPSVPNVPAPKLLNIATRLAVQQGDNALFAGLIVTGPAGSTKKVIIRGLGPSLAVGSPIADPLLELHNPDGSTVVNDNWQQGDTSQIPTGFSPPNEKESVIVATLTVGSAGYGSYTVVMKGAHDEVGVGLVEVYDLDTNSTAQLANIATRGVVQTGDNVLIGGFIVGGAEPAKVLVRATGPSFGASGSFLQDPVLEIHDSNGGVISNDNWRESQESEIRATGVQPTDDREPAIIATLVPGGYTAVVRGSDDSTGIAVVEAYNLQ